MEETRGFFDALFGDIPPEARILIWGFPSRRSIWCPTGDAAAKAAHSIAAKQDVYFGCALGPAGLGEGQRATMQQVVAIPGLWIDFDIANGEAHKKKNLPPNREAVLDLLRRAELPPTIAIDSGNGLHAYWLFQEPWFFADEDDRQRAMSVVRRWNNYLNMLSRSRGWALDSVFDLARVLRVPGTTNRKNGETKPVQIIHHDPFTTYSLADFERHLADIPEVTEAERKRQSYEEAVIADGLILSVDAKVDLDLIQALSEADPKFQLTWERKRKDFLDQSPSSYDMALANMGARAGLPDQEIVNLSIAWRRQHGEMQKLRLDYYQRTLAKAKAAIRRDEALEELTIIAEEDADAGPPKPVEQMTQEEEDADRKRRAKILAHVSEILGIQILRIVRYRATQGQYRLVTEKGHVMLGGIAGITNQTLFRNALADCAGHVISEYKLKNWIPIAQCLRSAAEDEEIGREATEDGALRSYLEMYLADNPPNATRDDGVIEHGHSYQDEGRIYIHGPEFRKWLQHRYQEPLKPQEMGAALKLIGAKPVIVNYYKPNCRPGRMTRSSREYWQLPTDITGEEVAEEGGE